MDADTRRKLPTRVGNNSGDEESFVSATPEPNAANSKQIEKIVLNKRKRRLLWRPILHFRNRPGFDVPGGVSAAQVQFNASVLIRAKEGRRSGVGY